MKKLIALIAAMSMLLVSCSKDDTAGSSSQGDNTPAESSQAAEDTSSEADTPAQIKSVKVMPYGDSITDGFWLEGGYRVFLCNKLEENGYSEYVDFVGRKNSGNCYDGDHNGYTAYSIDTISESVTGGRTGITKTCAAIMEKYPTDLVLLQIGTNDILSIYELDTIGDRLKNLTDIMLEYIPEDGMLYIATIPCMDATDNTYIPAEHFTVESMDGYIDDYNQVIKDLVEAYKAEGKNVELADINSVLTKEDLYDGVHPTEEGYQKIADYWYDIIVDFITE